MKPGEALLAFGPAPAEGRREGRAGAEPVARGRSGRGRGQPVFRICGRWIPPDASSIAVMRVPLEGLGEAINDRLARAPRLRATSKRSDRTSRSHERR